MPRSVCLSRTSNTWQVLKHAADAVKTRTIPPEVVLYWVERISTIEPQIADVLQDEREEKAIRVAEMEANKASNMITYRDEIAARPARSWFQTEKERASVKELTKAQQPTATRAEAEIESKPSKEEKKKPIKRDRFAGMSRKKRRAIQRDEAFATAVEGEESGVKLPNQKALARAAKSEARGKPAVLGKRQMPEAQGASQPKKQKKQQPSAEPASASEKRIKHVPKKVKSHSKPKFSKRRR